MNVLSVELTLIYLSPSEYNVKTSLNCVTVKEHGPLTFVMCFGIKNRHIIHLFIHSLKFKFMKLIIRSFTMLIIVFIMASRSKDDTTLANVTYKATLNGTSEVPSNASSAIGLATLTYDPNTKLFTIVVTHNLATATGGHIHKAATGVNGEVIFPFLSLTSPINYTSTALDATQLSDLNAGLYYVNLHTASFPSGEIRGQLIKQ